MQLKLQMYGSSKETMVMKLDDIGRSLVFLEKLTGYQSSSRVLTAMHGTRAILEDTHTHTVAYLNIQENW